MSRRVRLPGASELFRPTGNEAAEAPATEATRSSSAASRTGGPDPAPTAGGSGRVRHEEKITVYVSREELLALEQARLRLRGELGLAVDRGRLVRAAIDLALSDLDGAGGHGELVRRLTGT